VDAPPHRDGVTLVYDACTHPDACVHDREEVQMENQVLSNEKIIEQLNEVLQIDIDAVGAYQAAIDSLDVLDIKQQLIRFKGDHDRHVVDLRGIIQRLGGDPNKRPDIKGAARKTMTKIAGLVGAETILRAMLSNERATNDVYAKHVQKSFPPDILDLLRRNYGDEQRHLAWVQSALQQRLWEQPSAPIVP
jgi:uncharacterized protein (TIGR02284 family)